MDWIDLAQDRGRWRAVVNAGNFLSSWRLVRFSGRPLLDGVICQLFTNICSGLNSWRLHLTGGREFSVTRWKHCCSNDHINHVTGRSEYTMQICYGIQIDEYALYCITRCNVASYCIILCTGVAAFISRTVGSCSSGNFQAITIGVHFQYAIIHICILLSSTCTCRGLAINNHDEGNSPHCRI